MTIRTLLVDDEKLAIQGLQLRLEPYADVEIIGTCANGREAIRAIKTEKPDLVFLDIQMPGFDGFSVVKGVMEIEPPLFVFVTAYGEHARTFPARFPIFALDRIYVRSARVHAPVVLPRRPWSHLSDHAPLVAEISL